MALPLASAVEFTLMGALLDKHLSIEDLDPKTLSHTGQKLWKAAQNLTTANGDYDAKGVLLAASEVHGLDKGRLQEYMAAVTKHGTKNAAGIYDLLKRRNTLVQLSNEIQTQLGSGNLDLDKIAGAVAATSRHKQELTSVSEDLDAGTPEPPSGPALSTLPKLSGSVNGLHGLWLVAGVPGIGKSTLARQFVWDAAREIPGIIYDFENTRRDILYQLVQNFGMDAAKKMGKKVYIREGLRSLSKDLQRVPPPAIILVDSIQRVPVSSDDYLQGLNRWINRFEEIKQQGYTVILVSEVNRQSYSGEPRLDCFKDSGRLEYASTYALFLQEADAGMIRPYIVKNRHYKYKGPLGLLERNRSFWFRELELGLPGGPLELAEPRLGEARAGSFIPASV